MQLQQRVADFQPSSRVVCELATMEGDVVAAPVVARRDVFSARDTVELTVRDVRLSDSGVATFTAVASHGPGSELGFCSLLVGADCYGLQVSCCHCLDERVDGALFDASREHVVVWKRQGDWIALHAFALGSASSSIFLRCFRLECEPSQQVRRVEWSGSRFVLWVGEAEAAWRIHSFCLRAATGGGGMVDGAAEPAVLDASGWGKEWGEMELLSASPAPRDLNGCQLSLEAGWALTRVAKTGAVEAVPLPTPSPASEPPVRLDERCVAACFAAGGAAFVAGVGGGGPSASASVDDGPTGRGVGFFSLEIAAGGGAFELHAGVLTRGEVRPRRKRRLTVAWLGALRLPARSTVVERIAVAGSAHAPLALWARTDAGASGVSARYSHVETMGDAEASCVVALSGRGCVVEAGGALSVVSEEWPDAGARSEARPTSDAAVPPPAWRALHWGGAVKRADGEASADAPPTHPASRRRFSLSVALREHLGLGAHLIERLLRPAAPWSTAHLEAQALVCFGWDRTRGHRSWPAGQPRFFRFDRYRTQDLSGRPDLEARVPPDPCLVLTDGMAALATRVLDGYKHDHPVLIEGGAGAGKTAAVLFCAHKTRSPLMRLSLTPHTTVADFVGQLGLTGDAAGGGFAYCLGPLAEAMRDGLWLLIDDANLAQDSVLRVIEDVACSRCLRLSAGGVAGQPGSTSGQLSVPRHPNFRLFVTQHSADDARHGARLHALSPSLLSHFVPVLAPAVSPETMHLIVATKLAAVTPPPPPPPP